MSALLNALELSKRGYNAFALIYRASSRTACEDLARAIAYLHENAGELETFSGLPHGFGLGDGTVAEGWIDRAIAFWEQNTK